MAIYFHLLFEYVMMAFFLNSKMKYSQLIIISFELNEIHFVELL